MLLSFSAVMPHRIPEVRLAEPPIASIAVLGGSDHARLVPRRHSLAERCARLTFFFLRSFSSSQTSLSHWRNLELALLRGHRIKRRPALLHVLATTFRASDLALLVFRKCQDF